jgi:hypothetical protein
MTVGTFRSAYTSYFTGESTVTEIIATQVTYKSITSTSTLQATASSYVSYFTSSTIVLEVIGSPAGDTSTA